MGLHTRLNAAFQAGRKVLRLSVCEAQQLADSHPCRGRRPTLSNNTCKGGFLEPLSTKELEAHPHPLSYPSTKSPVRTETAEGTILASQVGKCQGQKAKWLALLLAGSLLRNAWIERSTQKLELELCLLISRPKVLTTGPGFFLFSQTAVGWSLDLYCLQLCSVHTQKSMSLDFLPNSPHLTSLFWSVQTDRKSVV